MAERRDTSSSLRVELLLDALIAHGNLTPSKACEIAKKLVANLFTIENLASKFFFKKEDWV